MKKYIYTLLFSFYLIGTVEAQVNYGYSFKKIINFPYQSYINSIKELSDSSFLVAGTFGDTSKVFISKVSKKGVLIETHYYYQPNYNLFTPILQVDNNDNPFMAFSKQLYGTVGQPHSFILLALSPTFNVLWAKDVTGQSVVSDMTLKNNTILLTAYNYNTTYSAIFKVDLSGNLIWSKLYTNWLRSGDSFYPNKNIFVGINNYDAFIAELDNNGTPILNIKYTCTDGTPINLFGITNYINSGYLLCGIYSPLTSTPFNPVVIAIDSIGNILWANVYHTCALVGETWTVTPTLDGGYALIYEPEHIDSLHGSNMGMFKIDALGNPLWCRIYNNADYDFPGYKSLIRTKDNGFVLGGDIRFNNSGTIGSIFIKTNSNGLVGNTSLPNGNCDLDTTLTITATPITFTTSVFGLTSTSATLHNDIPLTSTLIIADSTFCMDSVQIFHTIVGTIQLNNSISIFPNPFPSQTTISFGEEQKNTTIKISNVLGEEIKSINFTGRQLVIDKAEMKAGIYFVQTTDEEKHICNRKIIVQ